MTDVGVSRMPDRAGSSVVPLVSSPASPLAGRLSNRVEPRVEASAGMALTAAGLLSLAFLGAGTSVTLVIVSPALLGPGSGLLLSPNTNTITRSVASSCHGTASGMVATKRMVGRMMSMGIAMLLPVLFVGRVTVGPDQHAPLLASIRASFVVFGALCAVGILFSLVRGRLHAAPTDVCRTGKDAA